MIASGFGSFAIVDGLAGASNRDQLPKTFALIITAIGVIVILLAMIHNRKMIAWVNGDAFASNPAPVLPNERRTDYIAMTAVAIGIISFVALLGLP